jgi:hypothetical protein
MKSYNSQYFTDLVQNFDSNSVLPTTLSWSAETPTETSGSNGDAVTETSISATSVSPAATEKSAATTEQITAPPAMKDTDSSAATITAPSVSNVTNSSAPTAFKRYDKVVIVTKIHGPNQKQLVRQSFCLLHHAYNHKLLYDMVVFTANPLPAKELQIWREMVAPAKLTVVMDNMGFQEEIAALPPSAYNLFLERCRITDPADVKNLTWWSHCREPGETKGEGGRLAYNWQAEFRSTRIWTHPALANYKYMLWIDADGFCSKPWEKDPVEYFIENKGVTMFDHFPQGSENKLAHKRRILDGFNQTVCDVQMNKELGHMERNLVDKEGFERHLEGKNKKCRVSRIPMIHGFMHITDLDFYRQPKVINGLKTLLGDCFACRTPDDQLAVTLPAIMYAPEKTWDMRKHGFTLKVVHNFHFDGQGTDKPSPPGFVRYWNEVAKKDFPSAAKCKVVARDR